MGEVRVSVPRLRFVRGRFFWRPTPAVKRLGFAARALGADPDRAIAAARALNAEVEARQRGEVVGRPDPSSIAGVIAAYRADPRFAELAPATRAGYRRILSEIEQLEGRERVEQITRPYLFAVYRALQSRGRSQANAIMRVWAILLGYAHDTGLIADNPARRLRLARVEPRAEVWTPQQVAAFVAAAQAAGRASLGLAVLLAYEIGQRQGDVLRLPWAAWDGVAFTLRQSKTGAAVRVPVREDVRRQLEQLPRTSTQIIVAETTRAPFRPDHFRHEFARVRALAELPDTLQFRDLRRTAATELGDAGATDDEIRSVTGHRSRGVVAVYVRPTGTQAEAAQRKRAGNAGGNSGRGGGNGGAA